MGARFTDRLWWIAGTVVIVILVVATWFLAVSPQRTEAAELGVQTQEAHAKANELRNRIVELTAQKAKLPVLRQALTARQASLPSGNDVPAFLRQLQATGTKVGVDVSGVAVGDPVPEDAAPGVLALSIQLTAQGNQASLGNFLTQLQGAAQKRAVLVEAASLSSEGDEPDDVTLNLTVTAFVAPLVSTNTPSIKTD